jgi:AraC-like DNA-binding protein
MKSESFAKYPPYSERDAEFGLYITTCGYSKVYAGNKYPPREHPSSYLFSLENGRILHDFQLIYITRGEGIFESKSCGTKKIIAGNMIVIFPEEWHRYKPSSIMGWDEYWVGFEGSMANLLEKKHFISKNNPVLDIGLHDRIVDKYFHICQTVEEEKPGFQQIAAGEVTALIGLTTALSDYSQYKNTDTEKIIVASKLLFTENADSDISPVEVANRINIGYSRFRKIFKQYTGIAPGQYLLHLKIQKAKEMAATTNLPFKEISEKLGFENSFYFSKLFKSKTGLSPVQFRQMRQKGGK